MDKPKKIDIHSQRLALLDRYDYSIDISKSYPEAVVSIKVDSEVDVAIADIATEINSCDGMAYVDGHVIKVTGFDLHEDVNGNSMLVLCADLIS